MVLDAEPLEQTDDRRGEPLPLQVGLRAGEHEERRPLPVMGELDRQRRLLVALPVILNEHHRRAAGAVVEQRVDVEGDERLRVVLLDQLFPRQPGGAAGVDEAGHRLHQHRALQRCERLVGQIGGQGVQLGGIEHVGGLLRSGT